MDKRTQEKIDEINASIPEELKNNLVSKEDNQELLEAKEQAEFILHRMEGDRNIISSRQKRQLKESLEGFLKNTDFTKKVEKVNPKATEGIDNFLKGAMEKEVKAGRLNPASKTDIESFMRKITRK
jgi:ERCC4-type nuclease